MKVDKEADGEDEPQKKAPDQKERKNNQTQQRGNKDIKLLTDYALI